MTDKEVEMLLNKSFKNLSLTGRPIINTIVLDSGGSIANLCFKGISFQTIRLSDLFCDTIKKRCSKTKDERFAEINKTIEERKNRLKDVRELFTNDSVKIVNTKVFLDVYKKVAGNTTSNIFSSKRQIKNTPPGEHVRRTDNIPSNPIHGSGASSRNSAIPNYNESEETTRKIVSANLRQLIWERRVSQKELADLTCVELASIKDYLNGKCIPPALFFVRLRKLYGISIDDFLTKSINPGLALAAGSSMIGLVGVDRQGFSGYPEPGRSWHMGQYLRDTCRKYCGSYFTYYFDTSKYKDRDTLPLDVSLLYGVLLVNYIAIIFSSKKQILTFRDVRGAPLLEQCA